MYPSHSSHPFDYSTHDSSSAQAGPSSLRTASPHPAAGGNTPGQTAGFNRYLAHSFHSGPGEGSHPEPVLGGDWRQSDRAQLGEMAFRAQNQMMPWGNAQGRVEGYAGGQWDSPYAASMGIGQMYERQGDGASWRMGDGALMEEEERRRIDLSRDDGKREILLLNQTLTELITLLNPFRPSPGHPQPDPPAYILPRLAHLANSVHFILTQLAPRFRLNTQAPGVPSPRRVRPRLGSRGRSRSSLGRSEVRDLTSPEREMEAIIKRRDALLARAKNAPERDKAGGKDQSGRQEEEMDADGEDEPDGETTSLVGPGNTYLPPPLDFPNAQQHHLHQLGSNIGVGNYDNRSSFLPSSSSFQADHISRSFSDGLIFAPGPDTIDNLSSETPFHSAPGSTLIVAPNPNPSSDALSSLLGLPLSPTSHFSMPPPPPPPPRPPFKYGPTPADGEQGGGQENGYGRQRCHGCGVVVEGKWMQGPDGPSSLCSSCGLHYAKLNKRRAGEIVNKSEPAIGGWGAPSVIAAPTGA